MSNPHTVKGETGPWEIVVGLEVNAQVTAVSKLFSGAVPNTQVSLVDTAMPGILPMLNGECFRQAMRTGLALGAMVIRFSRFDRNSYFYAYLRLGLQRIGRPLDGQTVLNAGPALEQAANFTARPHNSGSGST
jgi:aspartyl-tRNA(Asn)/glutamyl-tRNA(Gln) amidotransferase subunit B